MDNLNPSKLGTKQHWDDVYETELTNFRDNGDEGEIWFGVQAVDKMVKWALDNAPPSPKTLEVGSGNGTLLFALAEAGYDPHSLFGIDYSPGAVQLARAIATESNYQDITFSECDFLSQDPPQTEWDLILDKGTFDAIALAEKDADGGSPVAKYPPRVARLLKPGAMFLITSCNFTEDELKTAFQAAGLVYHSRIQHRTITFGGKSGSQCSSVAFSKSFSDASLDKSSHVS
ncbi:Protein-lysine N-methyltransferase EFM4 [Mycena indigotica]|uniref:Protein-lysine N-methyltransferase EFM4 n=1 Tax=Mycena indigotica TaxID=2126181 RepID=A0A8H6T7N5_9AGAR|nr:Protein-lysine N-methyltransferase EFM4 [Mycena indigotica]KAF7312420.1 Protein-lysine N-methyltransferase EFM4 [Mycena indigotica]